MNQTLTIRIEPDLMQGLEAEARRTKTSKGELVRRALRRQLTKTQPSALDVLGGLRGLVRGPADLSTNKKHLAPLGRKGKAA